MMSQYIAWNGGKLDKNSKKKCVVDFDIIVVRNNRQKYANGSKSRINSLYYN